MGVIATGGASDRSGMDGQVEGARGCDCRSVGRAGECAVSVSWAGVQVMNLFATP
jgi:hypothetical protein